MLKKASGYIGVIIATLFIIGCTNPEQTVEIPEVIEEPVVVEEPKEIPVVTDVTEMEEEKTKVEEPVEEINPRDMKAVYGLDYDVPVYTEEEIEQAKSNITSNYDRYIINNLDEFMDGGYTEEQVKEMAPDYYAANQDLWCQLNDMVKDYHGAPAGTYYDEENDLYITVDSKGYMKINGKSFKYVKAPNNDIKVPIGEVRAYDQIQVGPGAHVILGADVVRQWAYEGSAEMYENYDGRSFEELEKAGYDHQKIEYECVNIED